MKTSKNWDRVPEGIERNDRDHKRGSRSQRQKRNFSEDYPEILREDKRDPIEGLEEVVVKL